MAKFTNELNNYQNIPREVVFDSTLSDRARFIYCFMACKPNDWDFFLEPMAKEIGYSVDTLRKYINELVESGWLQKGEQGRDKGVFGAVDYTLKASKTPTRKNTDTEKHRHRKIPIQHNIDDKQKIDNKKNKDNKFNFLQAVIDLGVDEQVAKDWLLVRKDKKATNTQTAFERIAKEIRQCAITPNECISIAVERSWIGFKVEWLDNIFNKKPYSQIKESTNIDNEQETNNDNLFINGQEYR